MPNVVTPFLRRHHKRHEAEAPRHRRDGFFDEHDEWHDATETAAPQPTRAHG